MVGVMVLIERYPWLLLIAPILVSCSGMPPSKGHDPRPAAVETPEPPPEHSAAPAPSKAAPPRPATSAPARILPSSAALDLLRRADQAGRDGQIRDAALWLERARRISPNSGEVYLAMAQLKAAQGDSEQARILCRKAQSLSGTDRDFKHLVDRVCQHF